MFRKILIANRGEIACRVIRTAREDGHRRRLPSIPTRTPGPCTCAWPMSPTTLVAPHPPTAICAWNGCSTRSKPPGAEAVHPGYGFLSENAAFAEALEEAGIAFIGPGIRAITSMGDKIASKQLAGEAGVNTIPGYTDVI